jgi:type VI secretion system protein ImpJ
MKNPMVHWYEGMFLRPQHFQASDRYWSELVWQNEFLDHPHGVGVSVLRLSKESLDNNILEIREIQARLSDGTLVESDSQGLAPVNLTERLKDNRHPTITVYIAIPSLVSDKKAVSSEGSGLTRYRQEKIDCKDENHDPQQSNANPPIEIKKENLRLLFEGEDTSGFETLAIAKLRNISVGTIKFGFVEDFYPPSISLSAWKSQFELVQELLSFLMNRRSLLSRPLADPGLDFSRIANSDFERFFLVHQLNMATAELRELVSNPRVHPEVVYRCLLRIAGAISVFGEERQFSESEVDPYDHYNQCQVFRRIDVYIRRIVNSVRFEIVPSSDFVGSEYGMQCALNAEWLGPEWELVLCVQYLSSKGGFKSFEQRTFFKTMFDEIQKDWKLGPISQVEHYFRNQVKALQLENFEKALLPEAMQRDTFFRGRRFFTIVREGDPWNYLQMGEPILGIRIKKELIANLQNLKGSRQLYINYRGEPHGFELTMYAWKKKSIDLTSYSSRSS